MELALVSLLRAEARIVTRCSRNALSLTIDVAFNFARGFQPNLLQVPSHCAGHNIANISIHGMSNPPMPHNNCYLCCEIFVLPMYQNWTHTFLLTFLATSHTLAHRPI